MSFANWEFPHTRYYEGDLRELIRMYKELQDVYNTILDDVNNSVQDYGELKESLSRLDNSMNELTSEVNKILDNGLKLINTALTEMDLKSDELAMNVDIKTNNSLKDIKRDVQKEIDALMPLVTEHANSLTAMMDELIVYVDNVTSNAVNEVDTKMVDVLKEVTDKTETYREYVDDLEERLLILIKAIKIDQSEVIDPTDNVQKPTNETLRSIYKKVTCWALNAEQYDECEVSADEHMIVAINAYEAEYMGKWFYDEKPTLIRHFRKAIDNLREYVNVELESLRGMIRYDELETLIKEKTTMLSPISGKEVEIKGFFSEIVDMLKDDAISADEFDQTAITTLSYDNLLLSAYEFDWKAKIYI